MNWNVINLVQRLYSGEQIKPTVILSYMVVALCIWKTVPAIPSIEGMPVESWATFFWGAQKLFLAAVLFGVVPVLLIKLVLHEKLADYGFQWGAHWKEVLLATVLLTPAFAVMGYFSNIDGFYSVYPLNPAVLWSAHGGPVQWLVVHTLCYLVFYYLAFEFFFRGFLFHGLSDSCGLLNALLIQSAACTFFHFGHPACEIWGAFGGSLFWGLIVMRTNSIFSGWIQHAALGIMLDVSLVLNLAA